MFGLTVRDHVMIAHSLPDEFFGPAQGLHGATLVVEATWRSPRLDDHAVVIDIGEASRHLSEVLDPLRYANLDEHPAFAGTLSTTEAVAAHIARALAERLDPAAGITGIGIVVREHPDAWVTYDLDVAGR
ncbi:6-pyruvoyl trahydropterin synthase family protein [Microbacterium aurantiacum]|uniref:6-carboxy-5,6,7,8-tetrahydropterin synthase n=2 Tax=Microbacterium aurantiacum TaxID=162393 RepID=A0AAJ2HCC6_9MICO|nr:MULTISPECIES: 6-carboxytetrahydropterin synthase [Microbacterium]ODT10059.1 MAG: 6-pyruvoyl tetrahydrobiopterin synthase [Microbacterium sp. SCN 70-18]ANG84521.1 6-pyruvoyl tetrahydrobiopterin synthase [Microbacterium chocolatum]KOS11819.1 6-pyruvoyl tetrahydrobiopterin synthase [Microbacterium chocolatum]MBN9199933.1 6-carboxytetrahydropterin synthase [Microbacterium chocolatum]MDN4464635.1 6-carboxytetrahydropterin synthase [Microbacterium aurantiacum]